MPIGRAKLARNAPDRGGANLEGIAGLTRTPDAIVLDEAESHSLRWFDLEEAADLMGEAGSRRALNRIARLLRSL